MEPIPQILKDNYIKIEDIYINTHWPKNFERFYCEIYTLVKLAIKSQERYSSRKLVAIHSAKYTCTFKKMAFLDHTAEKRIFQYILKR